MLVLVSLVATLLPPALVWRVLHHRARTPRRLLLATALAAAALTAGWRATTAVTEGPLPLVASALAILGAAVALARAGIRRSA